MGASCDHTSGWTVQVPEGVEDGAACMRLGDVYALIVDTYATQQDWALALRMLRDMQGRGVSDNGRISAHTLQEIYRQNGVPTGGMGSVGTAGAGRFGRDGGSVGELDQGDEVEEEVVEEVVDEEVEDGIRRHDGHHGVDEFSGQHEALRRGSFETGPYNKEEAGGSFVGDMGMGAYEEGISDEDMDF